MGPLLQVPPLDPRMDTASVTSSSTASTLLAHLSATTGPRLVSLTGAAGVGKTTVLLAIAHQPVLRERFTGGIAFLPLHPSRRNALPAALKSIFPNNPAAPTQRLSVLKFAERLNQSELKFLLIADDLPSEETLKYLRLILRDAPRTSLVFATRDAALAALAYKTTTLEPLSPLSTHSFSLFASMAGLPENHGIDPREEAPLEILKRCAGRPLLLSLAGRSVAKTEVKGSNSSWRALMARYYANLQNAERDPKRPTANTDNPEVNIAAPILKVCKELLERDLQDQNMGHLSTAFRQFCVLPRPAEVDATLLIQMCGPLQPGQFGSFIDGLHNLGLLIQRGSNEIVPRYAIHDVILDWLEAEARANGEYVNAHRVFLRSFFSFHTPTETPIQFAWNDVPGPPLLQEAEGAAGGPSEEALHIDQSMVQTVTRKWWSALKYDKRDFLSRHLSSLLVRAECLPELVGLLSRAEWTAVHVSRDELNELRNDFEVCLNALSALNQSHIPALKLIRDAIEDMWVCIQRHQSELRTQAASMLNGLSDSWVVERFISEKTNPDKLWLRPRQRFVAQPAGPAYGSYTLRSHPDLVAVDWENNEIITTCANGHVLELDMHTRQTSPSWLPASGYLSGHYGAIALDESTQYILCLDRNYRLTRSVEEGSDTTSEHSFAIINRAERRVMWKREVLSNEMVIIGIAAGRVAVSTLEMGISVHDLKTGKVVAEITDLTNQSLIPTCMAISEHTLSIGTSTGFVFLCSIQEGVLRGVIEAHELSVEVVTAKYDGSVLVTGGSDGALKWWDEESGAPVHCVENAHRGGVRCAEFATNADIVVSGGADGAVRWWCCKKGTLLGVTHTSGPVVTHVAVRPNGGAIVAYGLDRVIRWGRGVGSEVRFDDSQWATPGELGKRAFDNSVVDLEISADKRCIFGLDCRGFLRMWKDGKKVWECENVRHMSYAADAKALLVGRKIEGTHEVIDTQSKERRSFITETSTVGPLIARDASLVVMMNEHGSVKIYDIEGNLFIAVPPMNISQPLTIAASTVCERAISASTDGKLTWWDLSVGEASLAGKERRQTCNEGGGQGSDSQHELLFEGNDAKKQSVTSLSMSAGGGTALVGSLSGWLEYWKFGGTEPTFQRHVHDGRVSGVSMSKTGKSAVTGGSDGLVVVWILFPVSGKMTEVRRVHLPAAVTSVKLDDTGQMFVVGDVKGGVWTFDFVGEDVSQDEEH